MNAMISTPLLDQVSLPADLRKLSIDQLAPLAEELRAETIRAVSQTGGHLGAGLGVIELTLALHYVFDTPRDKLIWDVGHQSYPHKIITGRRDRIHTLRQPGGLSGFCKREESEYDVFGAGHSSTSISAGLGMAVARDFRLKHFPLEGESNRISDLVGGKNARIGRGNTPPPSPLPLGEGEYFEVVCVIGDGAMSAGMAYEAMNNAGHLGNRLIVILNDNDMSIAPPTGAMSAYLARLLSSHSWHSFRNVAGALTRKFPQPLARLTKQAEQYTRAMINGGGNLFEEMGFYYVGPIDGHNFDHLLPVLKNVRDERESGPILVHVVTQKGKGFVSPEQCAEKYHAVKQFDVSTGVQKSSKPTAPSYTSVFAQQLLKEGERDEKVVAITAAMPSGTGVDKFIERFPERAFDVGIAEQHAVTFAAGLAVEGFRPFAAIYSTFLQRAYDQVVHDVCIQKLPVRFAIDRAGLVGADGATHVGAFDIAYLSCLPNMVVMAAADEAELCHMVHTAACYDDGPITLRYPRGEGTGVALPEQAQQLEIGKGRIIKEGKTIAILSLGTRLTDALGAAEILEKQGFSTTVADARFAKPLDEALIERLLREHMLVLTVEEGSCGGFGAHVLELAAKRGWLDHGRLYPVTLPDYFQAQNTPAAMLEEAGLSANQIAQKVIELMSTKGVSTHVALYPR